MSDKFSKSLELFHRAAEVVPGGIYGHMSPVTTLPGRSPYYAARAKGCRYEDVDGNEYIDFLCGYGPIVLGYQHPEIEEAAEKQRREGDCFNHPTERMVELAEMLTERVDFADWAVFGKNGGDVTTWALQVAREKTGRKKVLKLRGSYHGVDPWCTPGHAGLIDEDRAHIHEFSWNDLQEFHDLVYQFEDEVAAVIITPFHHPAFGDSEMPAEGFLSSIESTCRERGIILILDDIRAGFRLSTGGSHQVFGFTPDMICFCKAIGNGYPISAAMGTNQLKVAASRVFLTGSYWNSAVPMAVAKKCIQILERDQVIDHIDKIGKLLFQGLRELGQKYNRPIKASGPPAVPFATFEGDENFRFMQKFCAGMMEQGVYLHPHHNWFISAAHQEADIKETLQKADLVLKDLV